MEDVGTSGAGTRRHLHARNRGCRRMRNHRTASGAELEAVTSRSISSPRSQEIDQELPSSRNSVELPPCGLKVAPTTGRQ